MNKPITIDPDKCATRAESAFQEVRKLGRRQIDAASRIRLNETERGVIGQHFTELAMEFWGATASAGVLSGVSFRPPETIFGKPVLYVNSGTVINVNSKFNERGGLSTRGAANDGVACALSCGYCSTGAVMKRNNQTDILRVLGIDHSDAVIRRLNPIQTARRQLMNSDGNRQAFLGFKDVMGDKLAYLTYVTQDSETWWSQYATEGAILL